MNDQNRPKLIIGAIVLMLILFIISIILVF